MTNHSKTPPRTIPKTSLNHVIGSSDGTGVQRAGSLWLALTGNSSFISNICMLQSVARRTFSRLPVSLGQGGHAVGYVRPRTSQILLILVQLEAAYPLRRMLCSPTAKTEHGEVTNSGPLGCQNTLSYQGRVSFVIVINQTNRSTS